MEKDALAKVVAIGGSAGSLEVILRLVPVLPTRSGVCYVIVLHRKNDADSALASIVSARTTMPVCEVEDKEEIHPNFIYLAPPDYHLLVENETAFSLDCSEKVNYSRPSIDVTFESVAQIFGSSVIGVLLSGANADGAEGLNLIKNMGGYTMAQDPTTAEVSYMPLQAIKMFNVDAIVHAEELGMRLNNLIPSL
jgi:two-component system chemotaxis response regulator CheB